MKKLLPVLFLTTFLIIRCIAGPDGPMQGWTHEIVTVRLPEKLDFFMEGEQRFSDSDQGFLRYKINPMLIWHQSPMFDFGAGFEIVEKYFYHRPTREVDTGVFMYQINQPVAYGLNFSSRMRFEIGSEEHDDNDVMRHRIMFAYSKEDLPFKIRPYLSSEYFLDMARGRMIQNRLILGLARRLSENVTIEFYGMRLDDWLINVPHRSSPVVGMVTRFEF